MIELKNISFSYGANIVLRDVCLTVFDNDFLGIVGKNGCGKTTLLKLILRLLKPSAGKITFSRAGTEVSSLAMGYLPQCTNVDRAFPLSVWDMVALGVVGRGTFYSPFLGKEQRFAIDEAIERMEISNLSNKPICELSGGEFQRALLARAIVSHPDVLLLDEPATYLDVNSESLLYTLLKELNKEYTIIIVGHDVLNIRANVKNLVRVNGTVEHISADAPLLEIV